MISQNFDSAFERLKLLVFQFELNQKQYLSPAYSEAQARLDFIDKFWMALGWDVNHEHQTNPYEQEVKVERNEKLAGRRGRADYAFFTMPNFRDVRFYVEAKKPARDLDNADDYFQTIRYGWSSRTPLAVLMDFEQVRIIDCRYKPNLNTAMDRCVLKFHYSEFSDKDKFSEIYWLFSREAVLNNSLEKYTESLPGAKGKARQKALIATGGYQSIDDVFLAELDGYREELARSFKNKNPDLDSRDLTEVTQRTLDRLVFMRFLEDKLIESEPLVSNFGDSGSTWRDFIAASRKLDRIYNGIIFKDHPVLDAPSFQADEKVFGDICEQLSHANSPYDFNAIPIHILGSIYERFLGKTIVATAKRATVEEKPEVRKAGGVYYTPEYIVRYIVENTVGKMIEGKSPDEIKTMHFADIACGSGSFLLGVYDVLLRGYSAWYNKNKGNREKGIKAGCLLNDDETLRLSLRQKGEILLNNVYGVDIDAQAVEVAQLSLYLKLLEDETPASTRSYQQSFREALLPSLNKNIVCGNSLIDWDILDGLLFDREEELKLNPMSFASTFSDVMKAGGFDAIVGNPPWGAEFNAQQSSYFRRLFRSAQTANKDSYALFIEKALFVSKESGLLGYITPDTFLRKNDYLPIRQLFLTSTKVKELIETGPVFSQVRDTWCLVMTLSKGIPNATDIISHKKISRFIVSAEERLKKFGEGNWDSVTKAHQKMWQERPYLIVGYLATEENQKIVGKLEQHQRLGNQLNNYRISRGEEGSKFNIVSDEEGDFRLVIPADIEGYFVKEGVKVSQNSLTINKVRSFYSHPKIWVIRIQKMRWKQRIVCSFDLRANSAGMKTLQVIISPNDDTHLLKYLSGILSSTLMNFYCINYLADDLNQSYLEKLPIRTINFSDPKDKAHHDKMVNLVEQMLSAKQQLANAHSERDTNYYENKCQHLEREIDRLVYELYDLTEEEIALVEGTK